MARGSDRDRMVFVPYALEGNEPVHTILLLTVSNIFMTIAWYGHLKYKDSPLWIAILASWGIASAITNSRLPY